MNRLLVVLLLAAGVGMAQPPVSIPGGASSGGGGGGGTVTQVSGACGVSVATGTTTPVVSDTLATAAHNGSYAILTGDCGKILTTNTAAAWTIAQAGTTGFEAGKYWIVNNIGSGSLTITATTSTFYGGPTGNISGSVLTVPANTGVTISSDGTNYQASGSSGSSTGGTGNAASVVTATFSATPTFTCPSSSAGTVTTFLLSSAMTTNITSSTLASCTSGQTLNFIFPQDPTGSRTVVMPTGFDPAPVSPTANKTTTLTYAWDGTSGHLINSSNDTQTIQFFTERAAPGTPSASSATCWPDSTDHSGQECKANNSGNVFSLFLKGVDASPITGQVTATHLASALPSAQGGLGVASPAAHSVLVGEGASAVTPVAIPVDNVLMGATSADPSGVSIPNCGDSSHALAYNTSTHAWSCQSVTGAAGSPSFPINPQTSTYQVLAADFSACKNITVASGTFTITLVASGSQPSNGQCILVTNYGSGVVTVARSGQNINGVATNLTLGAASATTPTGAFIWSDSANYFADLFGVSSGVTSVATTSPLTGGTITSTGTIGCATCLTGTPTNHGVPVGSATQSNNYTSPGTAGQALISNGASADPTFQTVPLFPNAANKGSVVVATPVSASPSVAGIGGTNNTVCGSASFISYWIVPGYLRGTTVATSTTNGVGVLRANVDLDCSGVAVAVTAPTVGPSPGGVTVPPTAAAGGFVDVAPNDAWHEMAGGNTGIGFTLGGTAATGPTVTAIAMEFIDDGGLYSTILPGNPFVTPTASTTTYMGTYGVGNKTTELNAAIPMPIAGTIDKLAMCTGSNAAPTNNETFTLRKNGISQTPTVTVTASDPVRGCYLDTTHSFTVAAGDYVDAQLILGAGTVSYFGNYAWEFFPTSGTGTILGGMINASPSTTAFFWLPGSTANNSTAAATSMVMPIAASASNLYAVQAVANGGGITTTCVIYKNGSATALTGGITSASGTGAIALDTTHSVSFAKGDLMSMECSTNSGSGGLMGGWALELQ